MVEVDVADRAAVGDDIALEAPFLAQDIRKQPRIGTCGLAIHAVVGAHHGVSAALADGGFEMRQIGLAQVAFIDHGIERVARRLRAAVNGEVLCCGDGLQIFRIVALHAFDERDRQTAGEKRIFAIGFHAAPPARIAKEIDVGSPEGEALIDIVLSAADVFVVIATRMKRTMRDKCGDIVFVESLHAATQHRVVAAETRHHVACVLLSSAIVTRERNLTDGDVVNFESGTEPVAD